MAAQVNTVPTPVHNDIKNHTANSYLSEPPEITTRDVKKKPY